MAFEVQEERYAWEASLRVGREVEDFGMYLEERDGRKRRWEGKRTEDDREHRRPPKKALTAADMGGGASHLSPGWQVNDLDLELPGELSMNEALLSLAVFKQEAPSPTGAQPSPPRRAWPRRDDRQITNMSVDETRDAVDEHGQQALAPLPPHGSPESLPCQQLLPPGYQSPDNMQENKNPALLMCSPASSLDGFLHSPPALRQDASFKDDTRFQYVLAAATSIATKTTEETLTYLNQGQPYEIKLKKLGDLSLFKGKILKSVIKICFHERRLQYMEKEQISQWHADRPGERIIEVDVPLSYGMIKVQHPPSLSAIHVYWDPFKDVGVYIKVNCISTEFTAKKHGGEKGVPFRIQVETQLASDDTTRLHAAACQIKVFKLKGADRKHKQDREKVLRRPRADVDKYQPGCESTVLTTLSHDAMMPPPSLVSNSPPYSPEICVSPKSSGNTMVIGQPSLSQPAVMATPNQMKPIYCQESPDLKVASPCQSPGAILPDLPQPAAGDDGDKHAGLSKDATAAQTAAWLARQRFQQHANTFGNFSGADLLRLSRDDIIQICGLADGIRLYNALHAKRIEPRLTIYVCASPSNIYSALYLHACRAQELTAKLSGLLQPTSKDPDAVLVTGPHGARVRLTDELVRHLPDHSTYRLEREDAALLLTSTN